jgi:hypothetical protein
MVYCLNDVVQGRKSNNGINQTVKGYEPKPINSTVEWRLLYIICINGVFSDILAYGKKAQHPLR